MGIFEITKNGQSEYLVIPHIESVFSLGEKLLQNFQYQQDIHGSRIKSSKSKLEQLNIKYIRDIFKNKKDILNPLSKNPDKNELRKRIEKKSIDQKDKVALLSLLDTTINFEDFKNGVFTKYKITTSNDSEDYGFFGWQDEVPKANSEVIVKQAMKQLLVAFTDYNVAVEWLENESTIELHYEAYLSGDAYIREKSDVVRDALNVLLNKVEPKTQEYNAVDRANQIYLKQYEDRFRKNYDSLKESFESRRVSF